MQTSSPRLLIVDHDGKILHHLMWDAGQYVVAEEVPEDSLDSRETPDDFSTGAPIPVADAAHASPAVPQVTVTPDPPVPDPLAQASPVTAPPPPPAPHLAAAEAILRELKRAYEPLQDAIIVTANGTVLAATSEAASATMCEVVTALLEFGMQATQALEMGDMTQIASRDEHMLSILYPATNGAALGVTTASNGNLGLLYRGCQRALQRLAAQP